MVAKSLLVQVLCVVERSKSWHVWLLTSLNMFVMSRRGNNTRVIGCMYLLGVLMNRWYWACTLWRMHSVPPFTAIPCCLSGVFNLASSSQCCSSRIVLLTHCKAVRIENGRFFFR